MKIVGVIPARYNSSRLPGKPLADICGKPMVWWVYQQAIKVHNIDSVFVATDDERVEAICKEYGINVVMTSKAHDTPTSRLHEVSQKIEGDRYVFISGDEPLIDTKSIESVIEESKNANVMVVNAMIKIQTAPEVIDYSNIKVVANSDNFLLYTTRSPLPYPKGGLDFEYMKFVGIAAFTKEGLEFYVNTPKSKLERIEECDLMRFVEKRMPVKMVEVFCRSLSVDTSKDLDTVISIIKANRDVVENAQSAISTTGGGLTYRRLYKIDKTVCYVVPVKEAA